MPNSLVGATSPYLLMHAADPIEWRAWSPEALAEARTRQVPILLSVGYAACHWCHVMAEESFRDPAVAALVNDSFVAIKVDREERPDIDAIYMQATQALTGRGGWPMTVFLTPDGKPFFAGTYYPPERRDGMPSFTEVLQAMTAAWNDRRDEVLASAGVIAEQLAEATSVAPGGEVDPRVALKKAVADYDPVHGGFGRAPKFPPSMLLDALLVKGDPPSLDVAVTTLEKMARGGIHDRVGGGFHRYSVDAGWVVPHFEKMLYDNALLLGVYARAWRRIPDHEDTRRAMFADVVHRLVGWLRREMAAGGGGFAASLDADSCDIRGMAHEGIYYAWNPELLVDALGEADGAWAAQVFHVTSGGTFEHGLSVLQLRGNPDADRVAEVSQKLLAVRGMRFAPARDDKVIAAWNGWLIDSLVQAGAIFDEREWLDLARDAAEYLWRTHWVDGRLRRASRSGAVGDAAGVSDDYGAVALGFARLAGAVGEGLWLARAREVLDVALDIFAAADGGFHDAASDSEELFARARDVADNATPSGTATLVAALRLVALLSGEEPGSGTSYGDRADRAAATTNEIVTRGPRFAGWSFADVLVADEARRGLRPAQVVIVDEEGDPLSVLARAAWRMAPAGSAIVVGGPGTSGFGHLFDAREARDGPTAYVCRGEVCFEPVTELAGLKDVLWRRA